MSMFNGRVSVGSPYDHRRSSWSVTPQKRRNPGFNHSISQEFIEHLRVQKQEFAIVRQSIRSPPGEREPELKKPRLAQHTIKQSRKSLSSSGLHKIPLQEKIAFNEKVRASLNENSEFIKKSTRFDPTALPPLLQPMGLTTPVGKSRYRNSLGRQPKSALKRKTPMTRRRARRQVDFHEGMNGQPYDAIKFYTPVSDHSSGPSPDTTMILEDASHSQNPGDIFNDTIGTLDGATDVPQATQHSHPADPQSTSMLRRVFGQLWQLFSPSRPQAIPEADHPEPILLPSTPSRNSQRSWLGRLSPFQSRSSTDLASDNARVIHTLDSGAKLSFESQIGAVEGGGRRSEESTKPESIVKAENGSVVRKSKGKSVKKLPSAEFSDDELGGPGITPLPKPKRRTDGRKIKDEPSPVVEPEAPTVNALTIPSDMKGPDPALEEEFTLPILPGPPPRKPKIAPAGSVESPNQKLSRSRLNKRQKKEDDERREREKKLRRERARETARKLKIANGPLETPKEVQIHPLSAEWEERLSTKMQTKPTTVLAKSPRGDDITRYAFGRVCPQRGSRDDSRWLNDVVIDSYLQYLSQYANGETEETDREKVPRGAVPRVHCFNSFFWKKIRNATSGEPLTAANTWARKANIGTWDKLKYVEWVFIPVNENDVHWTLLVVSPMYKRIEHFDSFGGGPGKFVNSAKAWVESEYALSASAKQKEKDNQSLDGAEESADKLDFADWHIGEGKTEQQDNGSDCGMFTIMNARMLALGWRPAGSFGPRDMPLARRRVLCELLNGGLVADFKPIDNAEEPFKWDVNDLVKDEDVHFDEDSDEE